MSPERTSEIYTRQYQVNIQNAVTLPNNQRQSKLSFFPWTQSLEQFPSLYSFRTSGMVPIAAESRNVPIEFKL